MCIEVINECCEHGNRHGHGLRPGLRHGLGLRQGLGLRHGLNMNIILEDRRQGNKVILNARRQGNDAISKVRNQTDDVILKPECGVMMPSSKPGGQRQCHPQTQEMKQ